MNFYISQEIDFHQLVAMYNPIQNIPKVSDQVTFV